MEKIYKELTKEIGLEFVKRNEPMSKHTSFKIGGKADFFITIKNEEALKKTLAIAQKQKLPVTVIGNGSNLLVRDGGIRGIVIKIELDEIEIKKENSITIEEVEQRAENKANVEPKEGKVVCTLGAGVKNGYLAQKLLKEGIAGFEFAAAIPGTIGGAVYMNAGAYGGEMKDIVQEVTYLDNKNNFCTISNEECQFEYRKSVFEQKDVIITKVKLELAYGQKEEIKQKMDEYAKSRKEKQPIQKPSAGSTFKRGEDFITAKLIDECGLKGYHIGEAEVSNIHAGFIVNNGEATARDVISLIEYVQKTVLEKTGKQIKPEVKIIGEE